MFIRTLLLILSVLNVSGCQNSATNTTLANTPFVSTLVPNPAAPGDTITLTGQGFSYNPGLNIIILGETSGVAASYTLDPNNEDGIEQITYTLPDDIEAGTYPLTLLIDGNVSNMIEIIIQ